MSADYGEDLAWVHHAAFGELARQAAKTLLGELRRVGVSGGLVVDLACGSGILAGEMAAAGYEVLGVDASEAMLRLAVEEAPTARLIRASLLEVAVPACVAVTAVGEGFNYAGPSLPDMFARIRRSLAPGGVLLFDVAGPGRLGHRRTLLALHDGADGDWQLSMRSEQAADGARLTRRITLFRRVGEAYRRSDETHVLTLYRPADVARELTGAGFDARSVRGYGTFRFGPGWTGFVATAA